MDYNGAQLNVNCCKSHVTNKVLVTVRISCYHDEVLKNVICFNCAGGR
jgi:hypothetical protein